jgi:hypothetical protein
MSKKYFCKYLPVSGEIKEGDTFWNPSTSEHLSASKEMLSWNYPTPNIWKKVKLFLCSKDIQVGDNIDCEYSVDRVHFHKVGEIARDAGDWGWELRIEEPNPSQPLKSRLFTEFIPKDYAFKVIGEISSDALGYITEGAEFDEEQIKRDILIKDTFDNDYTHYHPKGDEAFIIKGSTEEFIKEYPIKIKGPCGHFH